MKLLKTSMLFLCFPLPPLLIIHGLTAQRRGTISIVSSISCCYLLVLNSRMLCVSVFFLFTFLFIFPTVFYLMIVFAFFPLSLCIEASTFSASSQAETSTTWLMNTTRLASSIFRPSFSPEFASRALREDNAWHWKSTMIMEWGVTLAFFLLLQLYLFSFQCRNMVNPYWRKRGVSRSADG